VYFVNTGGEAPFGLGLDWLDDEEDFWDDEETSFEESTDPPTTIAPTADDILEGSGAELNNSKYRVTITNILKVYLVSDCVLENNLILLTFLC